jgi:hypothetical protein
MAEWVWLALGGVCLTFAVVKVVGTCWCLFDLRKWRATPELWGVDWLDVVYRIEAVFAVTLTAADFASLSPHERAALTAGQLWDVVTAKAAAENRPIPPDGWLRFVESLCAALPVRPDRVTPLARLTADLGMRPDID